MTDTQNSRLGHINNTPCNCIWEVDFAQKKQKLTHIYGLQAVYIIIANPN